MAEHPKRTRSQKFALLTPVFQLSLFLWIYALHLARAQRPSHWPFTILVCLIVAGTFTQVLVWLRAMWAKQNRMRELRNLSAIALPGILALWGAHYAHRIAIGRDNPDNLLMHWMGSAAISLADLELSIRYPVIVKGQRVDMYCQQEYPEGSELVRQMDRHIRDLERRLGRSPVRQAHWVRGDLVGRDNYQFYGLAMSNYQAPAQDAGIEINSMDRHELAHFVIGQYLTVDSDPPCLLIEGWAQAMSLPPKTLAAEAWRLRYIDVGVWRLSDLTTMPWYRYPRGPVYFVGGAFVDYLLRHHGVEPFLELYLTANQHQFADRFEQIYHISLSDIEPIFWSEVETMVSDSDRQAANHRIDPVAYTQEDGKALWMELANALNASTDVVADHLDASHVRAELNTESGSHDLTNRVVEDCWSRGDDIWTRMTVDSAEDQVKREGVFFASKDDAFALERTNESKEWEHMYEYKNQDPDKRIQSIKSAAHGICDQQFAEDRGLETLQASKLRDYTIASVREIPREYGSPLIEVKLDPRADTNWTWKNVSMQFDRDMDYRMVAWTNQYAYPNGPPKMVESSYIWQRNSGKLQLAQSDTTIKLLDGTIDQVSSIRYTYIPCSEQELPPFDRSDFPVSTDESFNWQEYLPKANLENAWKFLAIFDFVVLCGSSLALVFLRHKQFAQA